MKQLKIYFVIGAVFTIIAGTLSHFVYQWSGSNPLVGIVTPVSESTWEHMKLIFFPMLLAAFTIIPKQKQNFPCITSSLILGVLLGTFLIPVIFYVYSGILGYHLLSLDIATFIISVLVAFYTAYKTALSCSMERYKSGLIILLILVFLCFILFTFYPPSMGLFAIPTA